MANYFTRSTTFRINGEREDFSMGATCGFCQKDIDPAHGTPRWYSSVGRFYALVCPGCGSPEVVFAERIELSCDGGRTFQNAKPLLVRFNSDAKAWRLKEPLSREPLPLSP